MEPCMTGKGNLTSFSVGRALRNGVVLAPLLAVSLLPAQQNASAPRPRDVVDTAQFATDVLGFLGKELSAHVADLRFTSGHNDDLFDPPPERVVGALASGEFSWGTFLRALASYSELSGERALAGRDLPQVIGKAGLIEARRGGKAFAQMYAAMA